MGQNAEDSFFPQTHRICTVHDYGTPDNTHIKSCTGIYAKVDNSFKLSS
jgi:hypothetical protein